jgi:hypothetical protein
MLCKSTLIELDNSGNSLYGDITLYTKSDCPILRTSISILISRHHLSSLHNLLSFQPQRPRSRSVSCLPSHSLQINKKRQMRDSPVHSNRGACTSPPQNHITASPSQQICYFQLASVELCGSFLSPPEAESV